MGKSSKGCLIEVCPKRGHSLHKLQEDSSWKNNDQEGFLLEPLLTQLNIKKITEFISNLLPEIVHYRNHLKNYRKSIHKFCENFSSAMTGIDFTEKLKVPVEFQAHSQHE